MNIDYNLYKVFIHLYEEKSISRTANKLYVSQPAISYSLKELEKQLGCILFNRSSKGIEPTIEAKELYNYISKAFNILNNAEEHLRNINELEDGTIKIGITQESSLNNIINSITKFKNNYQNIHFEIVYDSDERLYDMLISHKLDLIVSQRANENTKSFKSTVIEYVFAYNKKVLEKVNIKTVKELIEYPLILPVHGSDLRKNLDKFFKKYNIQLNSNYETNSTHIMLDLINRGLGIGYINRSDIENNKDIEVVNISDDLPFQTLYYNYIEEFITPATKRFIDDK